MLGFSPKEVVDFDFYLFLSFDSFLLASDSPANRRMSEGKRNEERFKQTLNWIDETQTEQQK